MSVVLVTDAERGSAVAFIRSLARAGHVVIAGDAASISPGRWSRSTSASFRYPDPYRDADGAGRAILEQIVEHGVDVVLPVTDATVRVVDSLRDRLPPSCRVGIPPAEASAAAADKDRTLRLAMELGVPVPATVVVESPAEALAAANRLGWPIVVKPVSSLGPDAAGAVRKFEVGYASDPDDLERKVRDLGGGSPVLLQECCRGEGVGVEVLADRGRIVRSFSHRRIHEVPVTGGASALRESVAVDPILLDDAARLMKALGWTGLAMVEFKVGPAGHRLMEINGRPWGSLPLAVRAGVDFPADYVRMLVEGDLGPEVNHGTGSYAEGVVARNLYLEILWISSVLRGPSSDAVTSWPPRRAALGALLRLLSPRVADDVLSIRDPLASVAELIAVATKMLGKLRSR